MTLLALATILLSIAAIGISIWDHVSMRRVLRAVEDKEIR